MVDTFGYCSVMKRFRTHYLGLSVAQRHELAVAAGTTTGTLNQVVYAGKRIELGLADCLVALCSGLTLDDMPLTDRAIQQRKVREAPPVAKLDGPAVASDRAAAKDLSAADAEPDGDHSPASVGAPTAPPGADRRGPYHDPSVELVYGTRAGDKPRFDWQRKRDDKPVAKREQGPGRKER